MGDKIEMLKKSNGNYSIAFVLRDSYRAGINKFQISSYDGEIYKENLELEVKDIST